MRFTVVLSLLLAAASSSCGGKQEPVAATPAAPAGGQGKIVLPADSPKLKEIKVEVLETANVPVEEVTAPCKIEGNPNRVSRVVLPVAGRVGNVLVRLGDAVREGQPLLHVASPDADGALAAHAQAVAALAQAKANLLKAQADLDRSRDLFEHNAVARKDVLNYENALAQATAAKDQAEASVQQAARRLALLGLKPSEFGQQVAVRAPIAGKIIDISVAPGEYRNDTNAPLMTIADLATVWVAADVPETSIRLIKMGERVDVELTAFPGEVLHGRVMRIGDTVDPNTRTVKVRAEINNPGWRFKPEMFGRMRHIESMATTPVAPAGAVVQAAGRSIVYRETAPGTFEEVQVKTGRPDGGKIPIVQGLKAGDRIVVDGAMLLKSYAGGPT